MKKTHKGFEYFEINDNEDFETAMEEIKAMEEEDNIERARILTIMDGIKIVAARLDSSVYPKESIELLQTSKYIFEAEIGFGIEGNPSLMEEFPQEICGLIIQGLNDFLDNSEVFSVSEFEDYYEDDLKKLQNHLNKQETIDQMVYYCSKKGLQFEGYNFPSEEELDDADVVTIEEFISRKGLLRIYYSELMAGIAKTSKKNFGAVTSEQINEIMIKVSKKSRLKGEDLRVLEGFFDLFSGMMQQWNGDIRKIDSFLNDSIFNG